MNEANPVNSVQVAKKVTKPKLPKSLLEKAEYHEAMAKALRTQERDKNRARREKNTKAIAELIKAHNLADFAPEVWEKVLPKIRDLLEKSAPQKSDDSDESWFLGAMASNVSR